MFVKQFRTGGDRNLGYLVADETSREACVVDASYAPEEIVAFAQENGYEIKYVFSTHDHYDHTNGNRVMERMTGKRALLYGDTDPGTGALFTGDTLFVGKVGGTDLSGGARAEYESLHKKLMALPDETKVYPGHDVGIAPVSTVAHERETNPFLLQPDYPAFVDLKRNWAEYKREHGIA
jgi:hydroxyacylglutathione hydrolase